MSSHFPGEKEQLKPVVTAENDTRRRAYTLLLNAYDAIRSAISYVRWAEDDIDEIAPSLWSSKVRREADKSPAKPEPAPSRAPAPAPQPERTGARTGRLVGHAR